MLRHLFRTAAGEDIDLVIAVRTREVAHVLDHAHQIHFHLPEHFDRLARVLQRNIGWRRNHYRARQRHRLYQRQCDIARPGGRSTTM